VCAPPTLNQAGVAVAPESLFAVRNRVEESGTSEKPRKSPSAAYPCQGKSAEKPTMQVTKNPGCDREQDEHSRSCGCADRAGRAVLINTVFDFSLHRYWPLILIAIGVWLFAKNWGLLGTHRPMCLCERCRTRRLMGPAILITLGVLFLLDNISRFEFHRTWPAILLVIGVVKLMQSNASAEGHFGPLPPGMYPGVTQNVTQNSTSNIPPSAPPPPAPTQTPQPPTSSAR